MYTVKKVFTKIGKYKKSILIVLALVLISFLGVWIRLSTISTPTVLDYDPWYFYRHAAMILNNNLLPPKWDVQSYFPPGRDFGNLNGWSYTIIFFYFILHFLSSSITLMKAAILSPLIIVALIPIPAYLLGKEISNEIAGLTIALFAVLAPTLIGVSMAGYCDTDSPIVFWFFASLFATLLAMKSKKILHITLSILINLAFIYTWGGGWINLIIFTVFFFALPIFRIFENIVHSREFSLKLTPEIISEIREITYPLFTIIFLTNLITTVFLEHDEFRSFLGGLAFTNLGIAIRILAILLIFFLFSFLLWIYRKDFKDKQKRKFAYFLAIGSIFLLYLTVKAALTAPTAPLLVNISVAELQPINVFSLQGFFSIASRVGLITTILAFGIVPLILYKIILKEKIAKEEVFLFLFSLFMFVLITRGIRFSLQFTVAASIAAGYLISNYKRYPKLTLLILLFSLTMYLFYLGFSIPNLLLYFLILVFSLLSIYKSNQNQMFLLIFAIFIFSTIFFISNSIQMGISSKEMLISKNWYDMLDWFVKNADKDALLMTWWDPGHILAGYTYYKGKPLKVHADGAHCGPGACIPYDHNVRIQDMGRIFATSNENESLSIIKKYKQLTQDQCRQVYEKFDDIVPEEACKPVSEIYIIASNDLIGKYYWLSYFGTGKGESFIQLSLTSVDSSGNLIYGNGIITVMQKNGKIYSIFNLPQQGIINKVVKETIYFYNNQRISSYSNSSEALPGAVWISPDFKTAIYMTPSIRDSIFTKMFFFNGQGLKNFELVYSNPEIRVFKVKSI